MIENDGRPAGDAPAVLNEEGPWGSGENTPAGRKGEPRNPWLQAPRRKPRADKGGKAEGQPSLEELIRRGRARFSGGMPGGNRSIWGYAVALFVALWLISTCVHRVEPQDRGIVTRFGRYAGTLKPGIGFTLPAPVDLVTRVDVDDRRSFDVPASGGPNLLLTRDRDLVNVAYTVNWSVRDPELYLFNLPTQQEDVVRDAAQAAMREGVAGMGFDQVTGSGQGNLAAGVTARLQQLLDRYDAGIAVQGVTIRQAELPAQLADAAKDITDAKTTAQTAIGDAKRAAADALSGAQAQAAAFDKVYDAYKLAPQVTRSRMYYDTMESILAKSDKVVVDGATATVPLPPVVPKKPDNSQPGDGK